MAGRHTAWPACHPPGQPADLLPVPPTGQISPPQGLCTCSPAASNAPLLTLLELLARICPQVTFPAKPSLSSSCTPAASSPSSEHQSLGHQLPAQVSTCLGSLPATRLHFPDRQGHTPSHQSVCWPLPPGPAQSRYLLNPCEWMNAWTKRMDSWKPLWSPHSEIL